MALRRKLIQCSTGLVTVSSAIYAYLLAQLRIIDWSKAGVWYGGVKGIPTYSVGNTVTGADPTGASDSYAAITAALAARTQYTATRLPAGIYYLSAGLNIDTDGTVLRGDVDDDGNPLTTLVMHFSSAYAMVNIRGTMRTNAFNWSGVNIVAGATRGSYQIEVSDASSFAIGQGIGIDQLNDTSLVRLGDGTYCGRYSNGTRLFSESFIITDIDGNVLTLHRPLYYTYNMDLNPQVFVYSTRLVKYSGLENVRLVYGSEASDGNGVILQNAAYCWFKNCEGVDTPHKHSIIRYGSMNCEARLNYFHGALATGGDRGYGTFLYHNCDANLIEDSIYDDVHTGIVSESSCCGNVIAYNAIPSTKYSPTAWMMESLGPHAPHAFMNLYEGNRTLKVFNDFTFGSNSHQTWFRNYITLKSERTAYQSLYTMAIQAMEIQAWNRYCNIVGNILGHSDWATTYPSPTFTCAKEQTPAGTFPYYNLEYHPTAIMVGSPQPTSGSFDQTTVDTIMRHGNYDFFSQAVEWSNVVTNHVLPDSFYLSSKPSWFGSFPWPCYGPDVSGYISANEIPAWYRYQLNKPFIVTP